MAPLASEPDSLEQLQSAEQVALLDVIDNLRYQGVGHYDIGLPQLIVCGDQSSGKSSVLEGLTRLRFPTKDILCTTFATEVVLRKESEVKIECTINPSKKRNKAQQLELKKFRHSFSSREKFSLPFIHDEARKSMSFGTASEKTSFSEDILQIRYTGPDVPSLTIVDLPGIIHTQIKGGDAEMVQNLVKGYMSDPKSIILAVITATNDLANQVVLEFIKELDPSSSRTMGIITKPDKLDRASGSESHFLRLAKNQDMPFDLGWHVVKNRSYEMSEASATERDESEKRFFATGIWKSLSRSDVGIDSLRIKLSKCLLRHIRAELPSLTTTIQDAITATESSLKNLGDPRESKDQQRTFLILMAETFQRITSDALRGNYGDPLFTPSVIDDKFKKARLRTQIQNLNIAFATAMYRKGHNWEITDSKDSSPLVFDSLSSDAVQIYDTEIRAPYPVARASFVLEYIGAHVRGSRPAGLPSLVNSYVIGQIFKEQSSKWRDIAYGHLKEAFQAVKDYVEVGLESLMDRRTYSLLKATHIDAQLEKRQKAVEAKLDELLVSYEKHDLILYDPVFEADIRDIRARRHLRNKTGGVGSAAQTTDYPAHHLLTESMDDFTNSEILDLMQAYYKRVIPVFISNVTVLAIENCLMTNLEKVFAPTLISTMSQEEIHHIASESEETRTTRTELQQKLEDMKKSKLVLNLQAFDTRTTMYTPARPATSTFTPQVSSPQPSRPRTPSPHLKPSEVEINGLPYTPPPTDPISRRSHTRNTSATPTKKAASPIPSNLSPDSGFGTLTPPHSNADEDENL